MENLKEDDIRRLIGDGDLRAAATLAIRTYGAELFGFLVSIHSCRAEADDVFGAAAERIWQSLATFRWESSLRTWMYAICRNESHRFHERARRHERGRVPASEASELAAAVRTETLPFLQSASRNAMTELRESLDPEDRSILILRLDRDLAWDDIARIFRSEENLADDQLKRESARLRKRFESIKQRLKLLAHERGLLEPS